MYFSSFSFSFNQACDRMHGLIKKKIRTRSDLLLNISLAGGHPLTTDNAVCDR